MESIVLEFITFYLLFWWAMQILYKGNWIHSKLENIGISLGQNSVLGGLFDSLSQCKFCIENHTASLGALLYFSYWLDYKYLIWGFLCASINAWIREFYS